MRFYNLSLKKSNMAILNVCLLTYSRMTRIRAFCFCSFFFIGGSSLFTFQKVFSNKNLTAEQSQITWKLLSFKMLCPQSHSLLLKHLSLQQGVKFD